MIGNPSASNRIAMARKVGRQGLEAPHVGNLSPEFQERESSRCKPTFMGQPEARCAFRGGRRLAGFIASSCRESD